MGVQDWWFWAATIAMRGGPHTVVCNPPSMPHALPCPPADCDVYFRLHMKLVDWGSPLPAAIGMG